MQGETAAMVFTDPPFNRRIDQVSGLGAIHHREFAMASGEMSEPEFTAFLSRTCSLLARHSVEGSLHFICMDWRHTGELLAAGRETLYRVEKPLRVDERQRRHGLALPQPARAGLHLQARPCGPSQQLVADAILDCTDCTT
jgi:hypothetical protein